MLCFSTAVFGVRKLLLPSYFPRLSFPNLLAKGHSLFLGCWFTSYLLPQHPAQNIQEAKNNLGTHCPVFPWVWRYLASLASHHLLEFFMSHLGFSAVPGGKKMEKCVYFILCGPKYPF